MSTTMPKPAEITRKWYVIDAAGKPMGLSLIHIFYVGTVIFTLGQMIYQPVRNMQVTDFAEPGKVGAYYGFQGTSLAAGTVLGNFLSGYLYDLAETPALHYLPWVVWCLSLIHIYRLVFDKGQHIAHHVAAAGGLHLVVAPLLPADKIGVQYGLNLGNGQGCSLPVKGRRPDPPPAEEGAHRPLGTFYDKPLRANLETDSYQQNNQIPF